MPSAALTGDQVAFYRANGYVRIPNVLSHDRLEGLRAAFEDADRLALDARHHTSSTNAEYEKVFVQKVNLWTVHDGIRKYVLDAELAELARHLAGAETLRLWHDHALTKRPGDSKASAWHQDLPYWPMVEEGALSCWIALDDVHEANGCMQFVPASHTWGRFNPIDLVNGQSLFDLVPDRHQRDLTPDVMEMPAGSCTFHHGLTFHYAGPNRTQAPRRALVVIYMPHPTTFNGNRHVVTDGLGLVEGRPIAGERFPVVAAAPVAV